MHRRVEWLEVLSKGIYPLLAICLTGAGVYLANRQNDLANQINALQAEVKANQSKAEQEAANAQTMREVIANFVTGEMQGPTPSPEPRTAATALLFSSLVKDGQQIGREAADEAWDKAYQKARAKLKKSN
jgi:hypothetical protein